jgi:hypothetical protein
MNITRGEIVFSFMPKVNSHLRIGCHNDRAYLGNNPPNDSPSNVATLFNPTSISPNLPLVTHTITLGRLIKTWWLPNKHYPWCLVMLAPEVTPTSNMPLPPGTTSGRHCFCYYSLGIIVRC